MTQRLNLFSVSPASVKAMMGLQGPVEESGLDHTLLRLVKFRVSQLNGCGFCLDMHSKDARAGGENEQRLHVIAAWREAPFYSDRERAALAWAEAVTRIADGQVTEALFESVRKQFSEQELAALTLAIVATNAWNRLSVSFQSPVGTYRPGMFER